MLWLTHNPTEVLAVKSIEIYSTASLYLAYKCMNTLHCSGLLMVDLLYAYLYVWHFCSVSLHQLPGAAGGSSGCTGQQFTQSGPLLQTQPSACCVLETSPHQSRAAPLRRLPWQECGGTVQVTEPLLNRCASTAAKSIFSIGIIYYIDILAVKHWNCGL